MKSKEKIIKKKHLYRDEIKKLLIIYCISFIVISILSIYAFLGLYTNRVVRNQNNEANDYARNFLEEEFELYNMNLNTLEKESAIKNFLMNGRQEAKVYELLYDFINNREVKSIFYLVDTEGKTVLTNNYVASPYNSYEIFVSGIFKQLKTDPDKIIYRNSKVQIDITKRTIYSIGKAMVIDGEIMGYLVFDLLEADLQKIVHNSDVSIFILTDQYNNVIITTNSQILDNIGKINIDKKDKNALWFRGKEYFYRQSELLDGQMYVYTLSEIETVRNLMNISTIFLICMLTGLSILIMKLAGYASKKKTKSIEDLIGSITAAQHGDLKSFVTIQSDDEFEIIGEHFNKMLVEVNALMTKNDELNNRNRVSQIKQLESQFNPHFIFNTLETLKYLLLVDEKKASEMIVNFANILRYSIDYEKNTISLIEDIKYLNSYLMIQKCRYNKRLTYDIHMDEEAKQCIVPKLIMQPIIENCINHSYKGKDTLHIDVNIKVVEDMLRMEIIDDGDGMSEEALDDLRRRLDDEHLVSNSIGLNNVNRRLKLLYGLDYGLIIKSELGIGTIVIIKMPKKVW